MSNTGNREIPRKKVPLHILLYLIGIGILVVGLLGACWIYSTAGDDTDGAIGYQTIDGNLYPIMRSDSKRYQYDLERMGGKFAVLVAGLDNWFSGLWHGKQLGDTVAFLSVGSALVSFLFGRLLSPPKTNDESEETDQAP